MKKRVLAIALMSMLAVSSLAASSGTLKVSGSTTVLPIAQAWAAAYMQKNPNANVIISGGGTGVGISMLLNGICDIANASREAQPKEIDTARQHNSKLIGTKLAKDGIALIVHPSNNVKNLTFDQIAGIYRGSITNWNKAGGTASRAIVVVGRDSSSGTYGFFQEVILNNTPYTKDMLAMPSNVSVADSVAQTPGAIGYVGMAFADEYEKAGKVKILSISRHRGETGMKPTEEAVNSGKYPLFRYLYAYTLGTPRGLAADYLKFGLSPAGQALVRQAGYLPVK